MIGFGLNNVFILRASLTAMLQGWSRNVIPCLKQKSSFIHSSLKVVHFSHSAIVTLGTTGEAELQYYLCSIFDSLSYPPLANAWHEELHSEDCTDICM